MSSKSLLRVSTLVVWLLVAVTSHSMEVAAQSGNGTVWGSYEVCYDIDTSAAGFSTDINAAADDWTAASSNGFEFVESNSTCDNVVYEGFIDGPGGWVGYTILDTDYGEAGCDPATGCSDPTPYSTIEEAYTVIEDVRCGDEDQFCWCAGGHAPLTCGIVQLPQGINCGLIAPALTFVDNNADLRWQTPRAYEVILHEFGHWLWIGDEDIIAIANRDSVMDLFENAFGVTCGEPGEPPDFYTITGADEYLMDTLYP